jgi:hypothetical protein
MVKFREGFEKLRSQGIGHLFGHLLQSRRKGMAGLESSSQEVQGIRQLLFKLFQSPFPSASQNLVGDDQTQPAAG